MTFSKNHISQFLRGVLLAAGLMLFSCLNLLAQKQSEEGDVVKIINQLFKGMENGDSAMVRNSFAKDITMATVRRDKEGNMQLSRESSIAGFLKAIGTPHPEKWFEEIWNVKVQLDDNFAQVWCDYAFYVGNKFSHCGVDAFHLRKGPDGWKIFHLADTRRNTNCDIPKDIVRKHNQ